MAAKIKAFYFEPDTLPEEVVRKLEEWFRHGGIGADDLKPVASYILPDGRLVVMIAFDEKIRYGELV